jgi:hypothetical protein
LSCLFVGNDLTWRMCLSANQCGRHLCSTLDLGIRMQIRISYVTEPNNTSGM